MNVNALSSGASGRRGLTIVSMLVVSLPLGAQSAEPEGVRAGQVVVSGTRVERNSFDLPMSVDVVDQRRISEGQLGVNASESLQVVPGVVANNRQNYAQDLQISIRGFGARSTFGVRGIRLYADGIPLTMPDGQGQAANLDLLTARSIEVLRGPFSALYGNSSGGVINVYTEDGPEKFTLTPYFSAGDFDTTKSGLKAGGTSGIVNYVINASRFDTNGYRDYSAATRDTANAKLLVRPDDYTRLTVVMNYLNQPDTQDPQGLTQAQYDANPRQVGVVSGTLTSRDYGVRKSIGNQQAGFVFERDITPDDMLRAMVYSGDRQVQQFLGLTPGAQAAPRSSGGVVDLDRQFYGIDLRYSHRDQLMARPVTVTVGLNYDEQQEVRRGWENFSGVGASQVLGVQGRLRRDETNRVNNFDQYAQGELAVSDRLSVSGGVRNSQVSFSSKDRFITGANPNDSGDLQFSQISPVAGALYKLTPLLHAYASYGKGFETPTFAELAYRVSTAAGAGINTDLRPNKTTNYEVGMKAIVGNDTRVNFAAFQVYGDNEITTLTNTGGRAVFQNVGPSTRKGLELLVDSRLPFGLFALASATYVDATFDQDFRSCEQTLCPGANPQVTVKAGSKIPGVPQLTIYGEAGWRSASNGFVAALEARHSDKIYVNDRNTEAAGSYDIFAVRVGFSQTFGKVRLTEFARIDNLFDEKYVGSVIVNETSRRYYESAPGRAFYAGVSAAITF